MRTVIQRVAHASVKVPAEGYESSIGHGLLVLVAFIDEDTQEDLSFLSDVGYSCCCVLCDFRPFVQYGHGAAP